MRFVTPRALERKHGRRAFHGDAFKAVAQLHVIDRLRERDDRLDDAVLGSALVEHQPHVERVDGAARVANSPGALGADEVALPALRLDENGDALGVDVDRLVRVDERGAVLGRKLRREPHVRENVIVILDADLPGEFGRGELTSISKTRDLSYAESSTAYKVEVP